MRRPKRSESTDQIKSDVLLTNEVSRVCDSAQLQLHLLAFGDVKRQAQSCDPALRSISDKALPAGHNPSDASIREHDPVIAVKVLSGLECVLHLLVDPVPILGMDHPEVTFIV